jgi:carboxymethylenebutenolidase
VNSIEQYLVDEELWHYRQGWISRREFLRRATVLGAGAATAAAMAATVVPARRAGAAPAAQGTSPFSVPEGDPSVATDWVWYHSTDGADVKAYVAWPAGAAMAGRLPGVAVCHENQGLIPHIQDVARRFAKAGYVAIAPDLVSRFGAPTDEFAAPEDLMAAYRMLTPEQNALDMGAALDFLQAHPAVDDTKLAATGYCFGGAVTWRLTTVYPDLVAAAPFYGANPPLDQVPNIRAAVLGVYGELDQNINPGIPALTAALEAAGIRHEIKVYPNSLHAFHADHRPAFNPQTAPQAWIDTLNWFATYLRLDPPMM